MSVLIKDKTTGQWTDVAGSGGSGGDVSKKYVDDQDQSMLTDAKRYADAAVAPVKETVGDMNGGLVKTVDKLSNDLGAHLQIDQQYKADNDTNILNLTNKANSLDDQLNNENGGVKSRVTALENDNTDLHGQANQNSVDISGLKQYVGIQDPGADPIGLTADIAGLNESVDTLVKVTGISTGNTGMVKDINDLKTTVGSSSSGLVKKVNDLETTVGSSSSGLVKKVNDLETKANKRVITFTVDCSDQTFTGSASFINLINGVIKNRLTSNELNQLGTGSKSWKLVLRQIDYTSAKANGIPSGIPAVLGIGVRSNENYSFYGANAVTIFGCESSIPVGGTSAYFNDLLIRTITAEQIKSQYMCICLCIKDVPSSCKLFRPYQDIGMQQGFTFALIEV